MGWRSAHTRTNAYGGGIFNEAGRFADRQPHDVRRQPGRGRRRRSACRRLGIGGAIENQGTASFDRASFSGNQAHGGATTHGRGSGGLRLRRRDRQWEPRHTDRQQLLVCRQPGRLAASATSRAAASSTASAAAAPSTTGIPPSSPTAASPATRPSAAPPTRAWTAAIAVGAPSQSGSSFASRTAMTIRGVPSATIRRSAQRPAPATSAEPLAAAPSWNGFSQVASTMTIQDCFVHRQSGRRRRWRFRRMGARRGSRCWNRPSTVAVANSTFTTNRGGRRRRWRAAAWRRHLQHRTGTQTMAPERA